MRRSVMVLMFVLAMRAAAGIANTATTLTTSAASGPAEQPAARSAPPVARQVAVAGNTGPVVRWETFYDENGNPVPADPQDNVGADSLYFKDYYSLTARLGCPKSEVPNPTPESCGPAFTWQYSQTSVGMDPQGTHCYEVYNTTLRRHSIGDGSYSDFAIAHGHWACGTDGQYVYAPVGDTVFRYTTTGMLVSSTRLDITPDWHNFSVANDTVWCGPGTGTTLYGYACSEFDGDSLTPDATWNIGSGDADPALVGWDGQYYYVSWVGDPANAFKRFNANRTLSASGTIGIDPRGVMCSVRGTRLVRQDSLYWKLFTSTADLYSSPKARNVTPAQPTPFAWQDSQAVSCLTPDGHYLFEVSGTNLRRTNLWTSAVSNYTLANSSGGACGTDGEYIYVPDSNTIRKYTLDGILVSTTTTDHAPWSAFSTFGFGVTNDTVWLVPVDTGGTWYGYACSRFAGGGIVHDATWNAPGGRAGAMTVTFDGEYYYMTWGGFTTNTFLRFRRDRRLYSSGTVEGDPRGVMAKAVCPLMIVSTDTLPLTTALVDTLRAASGGGLDRIGTFSLDVNPTFPATDWYNDGCRVVFEFSGTPRPGDPARVGDSLAKFVDLGGRVVTAMWADNTGNLAGRYVTQYMPFTMQPQSGSGGSLGVVHDSLHPIMNGVSALAASDFVTGNTHSTLRSPSCVCLAEWDSGNRVVAAYLDSADVRLVSIGFVPFQFYSGVTGDWAGLLVNAIRWVSAETPVVGVTAPGPGAVWTVGTSHDITWTVTNGPIVRDSIVYSTDNGVTWDFVDQYSGSRTSYAWTIPNTPSTNCYVRVFVWNAAGSNTGTSGRFEIRAGGGVEQPGKSNLPLAFALHQPCPNPSAAGAQISYALPRPAPVELRVYDVAGTLVRRLGEGTQAAGYQYAVWNGRDERGRRVAPGVYYFRLKAGDCRAVQKLVVKR